jgi:hypothetical protein
MTMQSFAVTGAAADTDLAGLGVSRVPEVWPPAAAAGPAASPGAGSAAPAAGQLPGPSQFALLLAETLTGARPTRQVLPWLSTRGRAQLHRLLPLLRCEHRPRVLRVLTTAPSAGVVEMTVIVLIGTRARALAVRLERSSDTGRRQAPGVLAPQWLCTDIEAA